MCLRRGKTTLFGMLEEEKSPTTDWAYNVMGKCYTDLGLVML